ncbi:MAG: purine/pyrimidine permease [Coriobacteriales bacterium]|nr:purine/pyrimidine permease [Coriobacteriales bacterium]
MPESKDVGTVAVATPEGVGATDMIYQLGGKPPFRIAFPLGLQHVLTMFVGNLAPVLVLAGIVGAAGSTIMTPQETILMVQCAMLVSGLTTLLQLYPIKIGKFQIGGGLPIVMGTSFVFVSALVATLTEYGLAAVFGAIIVGGVMEIILGLFYRVLQRLFPPIVIGTVLMTIGLSLLPVGIQYLAGGAAAQGALASSQALAADGLQVPPEVAALAAQYGSWQNLLVGIVVFLVIVALQRWGRGFVKAMAILGGIIVGYLLAIAFGMVDFSNLLANGFVSLPLPATVPAFHLGPIVTIGLLYIISGLETMGNVNGITVAAFDREATNKETSGAILADAVGSMVAGAFNCLPNTAFGQNAGIVAMTKVVNKWVVAMGAFVLIAAGFFPPIGAVFSAMPACVLGGAVISVFGMILVNGIKLIVLNGLTERNILILCITFGAGFAMSQTPALVALFPEPLHFIFSETTLAVCLVAVIANLLFKERGKEKDGAGKDADPIEILG